MPKGFYELPPLETESSETDRASSPPSSHDAPPREQSLADLQPAARPGSSFSANDPRRFSVHLCRLFDIPIRMHYGFPLLIVVHLLSATQMKPAERYMAYELLQWGVILLASTVVHELGHALTARRVGGHVDDILLWPLGGLTYCGQADTLCNQIKVSAAGPLTHIPQMGMWMLALYWAGSPVYNFLLYSSPYSDAMEYAFHIAVFGGALQMQAYLFILNMLFPIYPLDGGQIATAVLLMKVSVERTALGMGVVSLLLCGALGAFAIFQQSMLMGFVVLWMAYNAGMLLHAWHQGTLSQHPMFARHCGGSSGGGRWTESMRNDSNG